MDKLGKRRLLAQIEGDLPRSALLSIMQRGCRYPSTWIVLPDKRMVLWTLECGSVLNWQASEFQSKSGAAGALVSADGVVLEK